MRAKHTRKNKRKQKPRHIKGYKRVVDRKMRDYGDIDYDKKKIRINPKKGEVINTILHEEAHAKYPNKNEKWIKAFAKEREKNLSLAQATELMKKYMRKQNAT